MDHCTKGFGVVQRVVPSFGQSRVHFGHPEAFEIADPSRSISIAGQNGDIDRFLRCNAYWNQRSGYGKRRGECPYEIAIDFHFSLPLVSTSGRENAQK